MTVERRYALTDAAETDLDTILTESWRRFGTAQRDRYAAVLLSAIQRIAEVPDRLGSQDRGHLVPGLRSYPAWLAARRRNAAVHVLFYRREGESVLILRILHQSMDPTRHLGAPQE